MYLDVSGCKTMSQNIPNRYKKTLLFAAMDLKNNTFFIITLLLLVVPIDGITVNCKHNDFETKVDY